MILAAAAVGVALATGAMDGYRASDGTVMPLQFYVFPPDEANARRDFGVVPDIMRSHVQRFGEYPFLREKYGIAEFATYSFREHQTLPSYAEKLITGDHANDAIIAHELAHQWFGNSLSVKDWRHVSQRRLRHLRGDVVAGRARRSRRLSHGDEQARAGRESVYGKSLEWFFAQWIYGIARPSYSVSWATAGDRLSLTIRQVQSDAPAFTMPVDVLVETASGSQRHTVWNDRSEQSFEIPLGDSLKDVAIDPDDWILKHVTYGAAP